MIRKVASREGYGKLREELTGFPHVRDVIVEGRVELTTVPAALAQYSLFDPYEEYDVFIVIVDELTEDLFDALPSSWYDIPIEVFLNGTRKRLM